MSIDYRPLDVASTDEMMWMDIYLTRSNRLIMYFYLTLQTNPYSLKEAGTGGSDVSAWSTAPGLHQSAQGYYPYDPALAAYG